MRRLRWVQVVLVLLVAGVLRLGWDLFSHWDELRSGGGLGFGLLLGLRGAALAAGVAALLTAATRRGGAPSKPTGQRLPAIGAGVVLAALALASVADWVADFGADQFAVRSAFRSGLLLAAAGWLVVLMVQDGAGPARRGRRRRVGIVLVNVLLALVALEAVAVVFARTRPTRLLWDERSARSTIEANRFRPGARYLGSAANSGGYHDDEFFRAGPGDVVVAVVADSFGVGIVPRRQNFTTVAEKILARRLQVSGRVAVHNFGVTSIGLPEYAWLVENEVPETAPTRIVVGLFVGNDVSGLEFRREPSHYSLLQFQIFELARRLVILGRAPRPPGGEIGRRAPDGERHALTRPEGTFEEEAFLEIERATVELANTRSRHMDELYGAAFAWLARLHRQAGDKLLLALIPDEYQVNDELFDELMRRVEDPTAYDRFQPQRRLAGFCREQGIEVLDLLEPLARANAEAPVYRLRDTHWNARGNRVAGEALAAQLIAGLAG